MAAKRLEGKIALVTGGTRGIGAEMVRAFASEGARVAFSGTKLVKAAVPNTQGFAADFSDRDAPASLVDAVVKQFGGIDILVNNAGILSGTSEWDLTVEEWDRIHAINLRSLFFVSREAARTMRSRGGGSIITVSSVAGQTGGVAGSPAYASSKGAVIALTRSLARRLAPHRIRVNCLSPSAIETDMTAGWSANTRERLLANIPLGRFGSVEEMGGAAIFLASEESSYVTGQTISVNGGSFMN